MSDKICKAERRIQVAIQRLSKDQSALKRRNARAALASAIRRLRDLVDLEYPSARASERTLRSPDYFRRRGYVGTTNEKCVRACVSAGISTFKSLLLDFTYVPRWVDDLSPNQWGKLARLKIARAKVQKRVRTAARSLAKPESIFEEKERYPF